eukprot:1949666-Rhodomonas_salina.3
MAGKERDNGCIYLVLLILLITQSFTFYCLTNINVRYTNLQEDCSTEIRERETQIKVAAVIPARLLVCCRLPPAPRHRAIPSLPFFALLGSSPPASSFLVPSRRSMRLSLKAKPTPARRTAGSRSSFSIPPPRDSALHITPSSHTLGHFT